MSGRVQGVFFRAECAGRARALGLSGWVRNAPDGRVEAAFEGAPEAVDAIVAWCRGGPPWASVADVEVVDEEPTGEMGFQIAR